MWQARQIAQALRAPQQQQMNVGSTGRVPVAIAQPQIAESPASSIDPAAMAKFGEWAGGSSGNPQGDTNLGSAARSGWDAISGALGSEPEPRALSVRGGAPMTGGDTGGLMSLFGGDKGDMMGMLGGGAAMELLGDDPKKSLKALSPIMSLFG